MKLIISVYLFLGLVFSNTSEATKLGGTFKYNIGQQPTTLNPLSSTDYYASLVQSYIIEGLLERDTDTYEWKAALADKWEISKDGKTFTFTLRDGVKWHDGKPLTAKDVKFSFDAIMHPKNKYNTAHSKPYYEAFERVEVINPKTVKFVAKTKYFKNFEQAAGIAVLPKHIYENPSKKQKKKLNKTLIGTGPYILHKFKRGKNIILKANKNWWGRTAVTHNMENNYDQMLLRFIKDGTIAIQRMERGDLDFLSLSSEEFEKKTNGPKWGKSVLKVKMQNSAPKGYGFIGWNFKSDIFKSKNNRLAMNLLLNRELMIEKFRYGNSLPATGPWYQQSVYADKSVKPVLFNPKKALEILRKEGWKDSDGDQILDKLINGKKRDFKITILEPNKEFVKYLTVFKEDAKKVGVEVNIKYVEWNTFIKLLDERKFEAVRLAWSGGSVDMDPKQIWHSSSAKSGSNFISYNNPTVDKLITDARMTLDKKKRIKMYQKIYREIAADYPYAFLFNDKYGFYGHSKRMEREKDTYQYGVGLNKWWIKK
jgi:ABC-type transport system substrate-binding protein